MGRESWRRLHRSAASAPRLSTRGGRRNETAYAEDTERDGRVPTKRTRAASFRTRAVAEPALQGTDKTTVGMVRSRGEIGVVGLRLNPCAEAPARRKTRALKGSSRPSGRAQW